MTIQQTLKVGSSAEASITGTTGVFYTVPSGEYWVVTAILLTGVGNIQLRSSNGTPLVTVTSTTAYHSGNSPVLVGGQTVYVQSDPGAGSLIAYYSIKNS